MSAPLLRLVLARHGQTQANVDHVLDTRLPGPGLTPVGHEQAGALARDLVAGTEGPITALRHSRALRASETAAAVADVLGLEPRSVEGVYEVQAGDLEGRSDDVAVDEFRTIFDAWQLGDLGPRLPGGENGHDVLDRYRRAVTGLVADHPHGGTVVLISHGAALRLAATDLLGAAAVPPPAENHVANCGRVVMERTTFPERADDDRNGVWRGGWRLIAWRHDVPGGPGGPESGPDPTG